MHTVLPYRTGNVFTRAFPIPAYLTTPAVGIDVSDLSIKYVLLRHGAQRIQLAACGKFDLPLGTVENGEVKDAATLTKIAARVRESVGIPFAHLALPEEHAYLFQMEVEEGAHSEMVPVIEFHLKENVPVGAEEAAFDYALIGVREGRMIANVSVYPSNILTQYVDTFTAAGFRLLSAEIEGQATARALLDPADTGTTLIVDIGRNQASLSISHAGTVVFTANLETGGDLFTRAIAQGIDVSFQEAERLKREHGFRDTKANSGVYKALVPLVGALRDAIKKHLMYWHMHTSTLGAIQEIARVVLVGGSASTVGIPEYLAAELETPVEKGNVWRNVLSFEECIPGVHAANSIEYATAIGLALRSVLRCR